MERVEAGAVEFGIDYREFGGDEGVAIHVFGEVDGKRTELLRFDCFAQAPHYHYGPEGRDERLMLDYTAEGDPIPWTIGRLRSRLIPMLVRAGYPDTARRVDTRLVGERLTQVEAWTATLARNKGS
ncbi:MAG: hypothetical protein ACE5JL_08905 [Dehalococcoidia bacterium]